MGNIGNWILGIAISLGSVLIVYKLFLEENCYSVEKNYLIVKKYERICHKGVFGPKYLRKEQWKPFWAGN
jgi:hypothetical protein